MDIIHKGLQSSDSKAEKWIDKRGMFIKMTSLVMKFRGYYPGEDIEKIKQVVESQPVEDIKDSLTNTAGVQKLLKKIDGLDVHVSALMKSLDDISTIHPFIRGM